MMTVILALAWQLAGPRVAIFWPPPWPIWRCSASGKKASRTVALLGTAALLCLLIGIPLGIVCGRRPAVYAALRPALDFMQTMPAFVYLIPVIALFGIGKPPGVIATLIFGTPPVVRLTALGLQGVPPAIREAAQAYGATRWFLLTRVDLPLAMPSIMAGINQTTWRAWTVTSPRASTGGPRRLHRALDTLRAPARLSRPTDPLVRPGPPSAGTCATDLTYRQIHDRPRPRHFHQGTHRGRRA